MLPSVPGWMSRTTTVPAAVPSLFHTSSSPGLAAEVALLKYNVPPAAARFTNGSVALTKVVPEAVPLLFHRPRLPWPLLAQNISVPLTLVSDSGQVSAGPGVRSATRDTVAPLAFHTSAPPVASAALK